jgi:flagellar hook-associated protein 1
MSLISALQAGKSGLTANQKWSEATARNISNANTEGYVRKETHFSTHARPGAGVFVSDISREVDASLDRMHRYESSKMAKERTIYEGIEEYTAFLGQPNDEQSPASRLGKLENAFLTLSNNPGNTAIQGTVLDAAEDMAYSLRETSNTLNQLGSEVELEIKYEVSDLNENLYRLSDLNQSLIETDSPSLDRGELSDEIGRILDDMSTMMDIRTVFQNDGRVSVYTGNGSALLENTTVNDVSYNQGTGQLMIGTIDITPNNPSSRSFSNGSLGGLMALKDDIMPRFQLQLDEMARGLIQNFENSDASLGAGQAGLFTDGGSAYNAANLENLASRISVNDVVKPSAGGDLWRLRDGIGAPSEGSAGDATQIQAFMGSFNTNLTYDANTDLPQNISIKTFANNLVAYQQTERTSAEKSYASARSSAETIEASRLSIQGVNVDDELQKLILIEQSYAANSQTMKTVSRMMDTLLTIV